jgi:hypothetical protein
MSDADTFFIMKGYRNRILATGQSVMHKNVTNGRCIDIYIDHTPRDVAWMTSIKTRNRKAPPDMADDIDKVVAGLGIAGGWRTGRKMRFT